MLPAIDSAPEITLDSPLSSASLRYSVRPAATADGPGPRETRPLELRFAKVVPTPAPALVRYSHELQVAVDDDGRPLIVEETSEKQWATKHTTDGDEGPERPPGADLVGADATAMQAQQWVDKIHEARVVVVGERTFTILIRAGSQASRVDWRADYSALSYEWIETPPEIEKGLRAYLADLGLAYSAVDFAIDADGRWVFLESNSSGQYLWLESHTGAPITNALADLLAEGGVDDDRRGRGVETQGAAAR